MSNLEFNKKTKSSKNQGSRQSSKGSAYPKSVVSCIEYTKKVRYAGSGNTPLNVTRGALLNAFCVSGTAGSKAVYRLINAVRIRSVEVWAIDSSEFMTSVVVNWLGGQYGKTTEVSSSGNNMHPAHVYTRPPKLSSASFYSTTSFDEAEYLFSVNGSLATGDLILDVEFEFTMGQAIPLSVATTTTVTTQGQFIAGSLSGFGNANYWPPVGWPNFV
jgi:hypothetical protein